MTCFLPSFSLTTPHPPAQPPSSVPSSVKPSGCLSPVPPRDGLAEQSLKKPRCWVSVRRSEVTGSDGQLSPSWGPGAAATPGFSSQEQLRWTARSPGSRSRPKEEAGQGGASSAAVRGDTNAEVPRRPVELPGVAAAPPQTRCLSSSPAGLRRGVAGPLPADCKGLCAPPPPAVPVVTRQAPPSPPVSHTDTCHWIRAHSYPG